MIGKLKYTKKQAEQMAKNIAVYQREQEEKQLKANQKVAFDPNLPDAIICDLDGTLALLNGRDPFNASTCEYDLLNEPVANILMTYKRFNPDDEDITPEIIFVSGREDKYKKQTLKFLRKHGLDSYPLFMRVSGDYRPDNIVKQEIFDQEIRDKYNVQFVLDDRPKVIRMWRSLGLFVFDVNQSGQEF